MNFTILKEENGKIISLRRDIDNNDIFTIGDKVDLDRNVESGIFNEFIIEKFLTETDRSHHHDLLQHGKYAAGTIITNCGIITLPYISHCDYTSDNYILKNTECLSIKEILKEHPKLTYKRLLKIVKNKLKCIKKERM